MLSARLGVAVVVACGLSCSSTGPSMQGRIVELPQFKGARSSSFAEVGGKAIRRRAREYPRDDYAQVPLSLTSGEGAGLRLVALHARGVIAGPLAVTQLEARFENPEDRVIEGRFTINLPEGASVSRLAMRIGDHWQEAEVVELRAARRAYEDFLHQRQDPLLLERDAGTRFRARVFPIPARGVKDITITYSHELVATGGEYRIPLLGLPEIADLQVEVFIEKPTGAQGTVGFSRVDAIPAGDFVVAAPAEVVGVRAGDLVAARVRPRVKVAVEPIDSLLVLVDTSASQALEFAAQVEDLGELIATLAEVHGDGVRLGVVAFDQEVVQIYAGSAGRFSSAELDALLERRPLGASNLSAALSFAASQSAYTRLLLITDGIATAGASDTAELRGGVDRLSASVRRLDAICVGGARDEEVLRALTKGQLASDGVVLDQELTAKEKLQRLSSAVLSGIEVDVAGAEWVYPRRVDGLQPGDDVLVFALLPTAIGPAPITISLSGPVARRFSIETTAVARPMLERAAAGARIRELSALRDDLALTASADRARLREQITRLSIEQRVVADYTALLVLETEQDYARFGLDRRALADILAVGRAGIEVISARSGIARVAAGSASARRRAGEGAARSPARADAVGAPAPGGIPAVDPVDVVVTDRSPTIDPSSTTQGVTLDPDYTRSIPLPGRTFASSLGSAAGSAGDDLGVSFSGSTSLENRYVVDSVNTTGLTYGAVSGESIVISARGRAAARCPANSTRIIERLGASAELSCRNMSGMLVPPRRPRLSPSSSPPRAEKSRRASPYTGETLAVATLVDRGFADEALDQALAWTARAPDSVLALVALGQVLESRGALALAARAYGSLIDLYPSRADLRRFAGERLEGLGVARELAIDTYAKAVEQRPDHMTGHRLLGYALLKDGRHEDAFAALEAGLLQRYPEGRFRGGEGVLAEDLGLVAAAWSAVAPERRKEISSRLRAAGATLAVRPSTRFVLHWETDANDVDLHILDGAGNHVFYQQPSTREGRLSADVTTGYGPESFAISGAASSYPYQIGVHYYARGPMGYGMGKVEIVQHDGQGQLRFRDLPFLVMNDGAYVTLGILARPL